MILTALALILLVAGDVAFFTPWIIDRPWSIGWFIPVNVFGLLFVAAFTVLSQYHPASNREIIEINEWSWNAYKTVDFDYFPAIDAIIEECTEPDNPGGNGGRKYRPGYDIDSLEIRLQRANLPPKRSW